MATEQQQTTGRPGLLAGALSVWRDARRRGLWVYFANLVWLVWPVVAATELTSPARVAGVVASCLVVGVIFVLSPGLASRSLTIRLGALGLFIAIAGLVGVLMPDGHLAFSIYLTVLVATLFKWPQVMPIMGGTVLGLLALASQSGQPWAMGVMALAGFIGFATAFGFRNQEISTRLRHETERNAVLAVAAERDRIGRDIHDILGHSLTAITVKTQLAARLVDRDAAQARREIDEIDAIARQALADVRATSSHLREVRAASELASARSVCESAGIECRTPSSVPVLDEATSELFGYVIREGITNVVRHADAQHCTIELDEAHVAVVDDGRGLRHPWSADQTDGHGLQGLRERAAQHGATLQLTSGRDGTRLAVELTPSGVTR